MNKLFQQIGRFGRLRREAIPLLIFLLALFSPIPGQASDYYRESPYRSWANKAAEKIYLSETPEAPQSYEEMGPIEVKASNRENCILKLKRHAWRKQADGVVDLKYSAEITDRDLTCSGKLVRWKSTESNPSESKPSE